MFLSATLVAQEQKGHKFESDTDTEVIAKLLKHVYDHKAKNLSFREIVEQVIQQLVRRFTYFTPCTHVVCILCLMTFIRLIFH